MISIRLLGKVLAVSMVAFMASSAAGQWTGFPVSSNASWNTPEGTRYVSQIYSAICERCDVTGVAYPRHVSSNTVFSGFTVGMCVTNQVTGEVFTNPVPTYRTIVDTNRFGPFQYTYTNLDGSVSASTCFPIVTRGGMQILDSTINSLAPFFVVTNLMSGNSFTNYFSRTNQFGNTTNVLPRYSMDGMFYYEGIGYAAGYATSEYGVVYGTGATASLYTRWPFPGDTNLFHLASASYSNAWTFHRMADLSGYLKDDVSPALFYYQAGTNNFSNLTVTVTGLAFSNKTQIATAAACTVSLVSTNHVSIPGPWKAVTNLSIVGTPANTGDAVSVTYKVPFRLFGTGTNAMVQRLFFSHLNERYQQLQAMSVTVSNINCYLSSVYWGYASATSYDAAIAAAQANFQSRAFSATAGLTVDSGVGSYVISDLGEYYYAKIWASKWRASGVWKDRTNTYASLRQTYMRLMTYSNEMAGASVMVALSNVSYSASWPVVPLESPVDVGRMVLMDTQNVSQASPYVPREYGMSTKPLPFASNPRITGGSSYSIEGGKISSEPSQYSTNCFQAVGVSIWSVPGGFRYR